MADSHSVRIRYHRGIKTIIGGTGLWTSALWTPGCYFTSGYLGWSHNPFEQIRLDVQANLSAMVQQADGAPHWEFTFKPSNRWQIEEWFENGKTHRFEYRLGPPSIDEHLPVVDLAGAINYLSAALETDDLDMCKLQVTSARRELVMRMLKGEL